jgi:hypothetical protein
MRMMMDFDVRWSLPSAVESRGTNTLASRKYAAAHPLGVGYATEKDVATPSDRPRRDLFRL